jgi:class 3 adenylate cyclase
VQENKGYFSRTFIFKRWRYQARYLTPIVYFSFSVVDFVYSPEHFLPWLGLRFCFLFYTVFAFELIKKFKILRKNIEYVAISTVFVATQLINIMIYQFKGVNSVYSSGIILCTAFGIELFKLTKNQSILVQVISYAPTIGIFFMTAGAGEFSLAFVQSSFLLGMISVTYIYGASDEDALKVIAKIKKNMVSELEKHRQTEVLKNHFPLKIRQELERNPNEIKKKKLISNCVVGFADIVSSTKISNAIELKKDWELKERFLEAATKRAMESNMIVLSHMGDGFMFLANYMDDSSWAYNLVSFYENLVQDYQQIWKELGSGNLEIESGVKFGVSTGPVLVGLLGKHQSYFSAVGPDVNLAARLCAQAQPNEIVVSSHIWYSLKPILVGWRFEKNTYSNLKGFTENVSAIHIAPRLMNKKENLCSECGSTLSLIKTEEGFIAFQCANGHNGSVRDMQNTKLIA